MDKLTRFYYNCRLRLLISTEFILTSNSCLKYVIQNTSHEVIPWQFCINRYRNSSAFSNPLILQRFWQLTSLTFLTTLVTPDKSSKSSYEISTKFLPTYSKCSSTLIISLLNGLTTFLFLHPLITRSISLQFLHTDTYFIQLLTIHYTCSIITSSIKGFE